MGVFGCFEVTIGFCGSERVDYITYDTTGIWRCYEVKVSKSDFHSNAKHTFCGHFNYFVMPKVLYEEVKDEIPKEIGCYIYTTYEFRGKEQSDMYCIKKPKRKELEIDEKILKDSLIRSLYRDVQKYIKIKNKEK